jgi:hypothetical protein
MSRRLAALLLAGLALAGSAAAGAAAVKKPHPGRSTDQPRPRDGHVAVRQELDAARRTGTLAAYDLFIRRHANDPLAETARRERAAVAAAQPSR